MPNRRLQAHVVLVVLLCQLTFISNAIGHGGRLNSSGCHNVRKTGGYHCHRSNYSPPKTKTRVTTVTQPSPRVSSKLNTQELERRLDIPSKDLSSREKAIEAQRYLAYLGFKFGVVDGLVGPKTRAAIQAYQRTRGLVVDGRITNYLLGHLAHEISQKAKTTESSKKSVAVNTGHELVERTQFYMTVLELYSGPKDGVMNTKLEQAIMRFQNANRISVDGQPSDRLLAALKSKL